MKKVVTIGEILLRLSPPSYKKLADVNYLETYFGGSEYNVAVALGGYGINVTFITKLPKNEVGDAVLKQMNSYGIDTSYIESGGERLGIYFLEAGHSVRPSKVVYDRRYSSMTTINNDQVDIDGILEDTNILHLSGITLGISKGASEISKALIKKAKERNIKVSFDFNYRSKLWTLEEATKQFKEVLPYVDILFGNHLDFCNLLGLDPKYNENLLTYYNELYEEMNKLFNIEYFITPNREIITASNNRYQGLLHHNGQTVMSRKYSIDIIDRVGTGDALAAGFLYSLLENKTDEEKIEFATASSVYKHTIPGDVLFSNTEDIEKVIQKNSYELQR